jgi:large subunit ribosomal protein L15
MDLHSLTNEPGTRKSRKRRGRGRASGLGKTSGRGHKGQYAHKGHKHKDHFEGGQMPLIRRMPKRGFKNHTRVNWQGVNVAALNAFEDGAVVDVCALATIGLVSGCGAHVKILGLGELKRKLTIKVGGYSESAKAKITAAGGTCEAS